MTDDPLKKTLKEIWADARKRFNFPYLGEPELVDRLPGPNTAAFEWNTHRTYISREFVETLGKYMKPEEALTGCTDHETGHYVGFPRNMATHIYLAAEADEYFGKENPDIGADIYAWYADTCNEMEVLRSGASGEPLVKLRQACEGIAPGSLNAVLVEIYRHHFDKQLKIGQQKLSPEQAKLLENIKEIPYINETISQHEASMYRFGKALIESGLLNKQCDKGRGGGHDIKEIPAHEIDGALTKILIEQGPGAFNRVRKFLAKVRPDFGDPYAPKDGGQKLAGLANSNFQLNDELIPLYRRWAAGYGVYIVKKPVEVDKTAQYRSGLKDYEIGDNVQKTDIFASRGKVGIPGISKIWLEEAGKMPAVDWAVPDAIVGIDSSGSMDHPNTGPTAKNPKGGASQVLAAYIIGTNYWANGARVGGWNFSADLAFLQPSRDIDSYYSLMTGYWGGGTVLNVERLKAYIGEMEDDRLLGVHFSDDKDYERMIERLPEAERKKFYDKSLTIGTDKLRAKVKKLDNLLITDGYIANTQEVVYHLSKMGEVTRNFIFLTNEAKYKEWSALEKDIPNTWVYLVDDPKKLLGAALGSGRALVDDSKANYVRKVA